MRREAHVPRGGADGGDGGNGGDVVLRVDSSRRDLAHLRRKLTYGAENGGPGGRKRSHGKRGDDEVVVVPAGTQAFTPDGRKLADLTQPGEQWVIAEGGIGGWGNTHFVNPVRRAPQFAEIGLPGDELDLELRLKLMADAALAGVPNAGKSSLLRRISNARPKVGDYPFTTLAPVLGTIERPDGSQLVVVDVPGLLEGASEGYGLGHQFLSHFERARMLLHTISLEDVEGAGDAFRLIQNELWAYDPRIAQLPQVIVLTKRDLVDDDAVTRANELVSEAAAELREKRGDVVAVVAVSSATGAGLTVLMQALFKSVADLDRAEADGVVRLDPTAPPAAPLGLPLEEYRVYRPRPKRRRWRIFKDKEGFRVAGDPAMKALAEASEYDDDAADELNEMLERTGAIRALKAAGVRDGATINVCGTPLELWWGEPSEI